jgi:hypothetical protein
LSGCRRFFPEFRGCRRTGGRNRGLCVWC